MHTVEALRVDHLETMPMPCRHCLHWEVDPVRRARLAGQELAAKREWILEVNQEWGTCGQVAVEEDVVVAYVEYAPASFAPGAAAFATAPVSADAVLLMTVGVLPDASGAGIGRQLVRATVRDLIRRDEGRALEAFATAAPIGHSCVLPVGFLVAAGFKEHRAHPVHPRYRMDLRSVVTWREAAGEAIARYGLRPNPLT